VAAAVAVEVVVAVAAQESDRSALKKAQQAWRERQQRRPR